MQQKQLDKETLQSDYLGDLEALSYLMEPDALEEYEGNPKLFEQNMIALRRVIIEEYSPLNGGAFFIDGNIFQEISEELGVSISSVSFFCELMSRQGFVIFKIDEEQGGTSGLHIYYRKEFWDDIVIRAGKFASAVGDPLGFFKG